MEFPARVESATFVEIKRSLDPESPYIVLEFPEQEKEKGILTEILSALARIEERILNRQAFLDRAEGKMYLVVKVNWSSPGAVDEAMFASHLPSEVIYYFFRKQQPGSGPKRDGPGQPN